MTEIHMASDSERLLLASDNEAPLNQDGNLSYNAGNPNLNQGQMFEQFVQLLDSKLDQKLETFKRSLADKEEYQSSQLKKLRTESKTTGSFKFKGNKIQFEFNSEVLDSLERASQSLLNGDLTKVNAELEKLKATVNKRNKLIRFADKSPAGWTAVEEYESDELAENSEDEKKLRSAEKRAMNKISLKKQSKKTTKGNPKQHMYSDTSTFTGVQQPRYPPFRSSFRGGRQPHPTDKCFSCGQRGHWANSVVCQNRYKTDNRGPSGASSPNC